MNAIALKSKKILPIVSIICVVLAALLGIIGIINNDFFKIAVVPKILLTLLIIFLASLCILNTLDGLMKKSKLSLLTFALIVVASILYLVLVWASLQSPIYTKVVVILSLFTIFFDLVVSNHITLGKRMLALQVVFYVVLGIFELLIGYLIIKGELPSGFWKYLVILAIVGIVLYIVLRIKVKNTKLEDKNASKEENETRISIEEFEALKKENERLKALLQENNIDF